MNLSCETVIENPNDASVTRNFFPDAAQGNDVINLPHIPWFILTIIREFLVLIYTNKAAISVKSALSNK